MKEASRKPTAKEFFANLPLRPDDRRPFRGNYKTLRRRGLGQTSALLEALLALGYKQVDIARAQNCSYRAASSNWAKIRQRFRLSGVAQLVEFLHDPDAWPEARRSKPTPQQRPFFRLPVIPAAKRLTG